MSITSIIGTPFEELDCYGLVREVYKTEKGIILPNPNIRHDENFKIFFKFSQEISKNWKKVDKEAGTVVAIRYCMEHPKIVTHFGYYLGDNKILHTLKGTGAIAEDISKYEKLIEGFYKYETNSNV